MLEVREYALVPTRLVLVYLGIMEGDRVCHWDERGLKGGRPRTAGQGSQPHLCCSPGPHRCPGPSPHRPFPISPTHPARVQLRTSWLPPRHPTAGTEALGTVAAAVTQAGQAAESQRCPHTTLCLQPPSGCGGPWVPSSREPPGAGHAAGLAAEAAPAHEDQRRQPPAQEGLPALPGRESLPPPPQMPSQLPSRVGAVTRGCEAPTACARPRGGEPHTQAVKALFSQPGLDKGASENWPQLGAATGSRPSSPLPSPGALDPSSQV